MFPSLFPNLYHFSSNSGSSHRSSKASTCLERRAKTSPVSGVTVCFVFDRSVFGKIPHPTYQIMCRCGPVRTLVVDK